MSPAMSYCFMGTFFTERKADVILPNRVELMLLCGQAMIFAISTVWARLFRILKVCIDTSPAVEIRWRHFPMYSQLCGNLGRPFARLACAVTIFLPVWINGADKDD